MDENKVPDMMAFLFGEAAETAQRGASTRLLRWSQAFEGWLIEKQQHYKAGVYVKARQTWRRLLRERGKMPWELEQADIEQHTAWMEAQGYAAGTITQALGSMASFYRWCSERQIDPLCAADFNPAAGVKRPKIQRYAGAKLLSRGELQALLGIMSRDETPLGKRDYAFTLARLHLGAPLKNLQQLRWGQVEFDAGAGDAAAGAGDAAAGEGGVWVRWRPSPPTPLPKGEGRRGGRAPGGRAAGGRAPLPAEVWQAIRDWLAASGRLEGMKPESYIFAPLADRPQTEPIDRPEAWEQGRCISISQLMHNLKLYGRRAGIAEDKLKLRALRRTAIRLRLEAGDSLEQMGSFLDSKSPKEQIKFLLSKLPELPEEAGPASEGGELEPEAPLRKPHRFQGREGLIHGFYATSQPVEEVLAVLSEDIQGIEEEFAGLRALGRGLLMMQAGARSSEEAARLADAYMLMASRMAEMIGAEKRLAPDGEKAAWVAEFLALWDRLAAEAGEPPVSPAVRAEALAGDPMLAAGARRLTEEIAGVRFVLRNTLARAGKAEQNGETEKFVRLTDVYSMGCIRLMKMLRTEGACQDRLYDFLQKQTQDVIRQVNEEWDAAAAAREG